MSEKCEECQETVEQLRLKKADGMITGKDAETGKTKTMCIPCFKKGWKLKRGKDITTNIFERKKP